MEPTLVRKASVESLGSLGSSTHSSNRDSISQPAENITVSTTVEEKENKVPEDTPTQPSKDNTSRPTSLSLTDSFTGSAPRREHFPQKVLRVSQESLVRSASVRVAPTTSCDNEPVNKQARSSSTTSLNSADNKSSSTKGDESSSTSSGIKILPAYRGQTIQEMMQNMSPKATWHTNTKYGKSHSDSSMRNVRHRPQPAPPSALHPTGSYQRPPAPQHTVPTSGYQRPPAPQRTPTEAPPMIQRGRQSLQPRPYFGHEPRNKPDAPHIRYYSPELRASPTTNFVPRRVTVNDGTHPRMPMRATAPPTYHGQPLQGYSTVPRYHQMPENVYSNVQYGTYRPSNGQNTYSRSHHDVRNQRVSLENYQLQHSSQNVRTANSENNIHRHNNNTKQPHRAHSMNINQSVRSKPFVASSSSMNNLQYAQLMTTSERTDSSGSVSKHVQPYQPPINDTRHSYTMDYRTDSSSRRDGYDQGSPTRNSMHVDSRVPHSPVSRNPSYLNATNSPFKSAYQQQKSIAESSESRHGSSRDNSHSDLSASGSDSPVVLREKPSINSYESQAKISRRASYLMATNKPENIIGEENTKTPNAKPINFQKVKNFFGEKTPSIKEAIEKSKAPASPMELVSLPNDMNVQKVGILVVKILAIEGKKSSDRSWKAMGAALSGHLLYLLKDKKENATVLTTPNGPFMVDEKPVDIQNCCLDIAHHYTKKKHVFWLDTKSGCKYMFQAESHTEMMTWIKSIMENSTTENMSSLKSERLTSAELIKRINDQQSKIQQQKKKISSFKSKNSTSTLSTKNSSESGKKDKKRAQYGTPRSLPFGTQNPVGDFGIPISECKPSHENDYVPWVVESCIKTIEEKGMDVVGIYRVPGNKAAVSQLINELNEGVINFDNERWQDVNVLSSLLKQFFSRLPDSLITTAKYPEFMEKNGISDPTKRLLSLKQLVRTLPETNFETLRYFAAHLNKIAQYEEINKMDTRNLAMMFGPTILRTSDTAEDSMKASMAFAADMSAQYRIMESMIIYHDWMFNEEDSPPPDRSLNESANATISQTMNDMSADLNKLVNSSQSKSQLMSAFANAANKNISKTALKSPTINKEQTIPDKPPRDDYDDHGFKNRDIQEQVAARNRSIQHHNQQREQYNSIHQSPSHSHSTINRPSFCASEEWSAALNAQMQTTDYPMQLNHKWHSEESILANEKPRHSLKVILKNQPGTAFSHSEHQLNPPPVPSRDANRPPLPPKPLKLYRAVPAYTGCISPEHSQHVPLSAGIAQNKTFYENYDDFTSPQKTPLRKERSLARRGSLDSLMDRYEPPQFSDSEDESDLVTAMENEWAQRSKMVFPTYQNQSFDQCQQNYNTQSSDRSRESLLSILSNKEVINNYETSSSHDICSSDRGSYSSLGSQPHRKEMKVGIAYRFERNDKPADYPVQYTTQQSPLVVNATRTVNEACLSPSSGEATNSEEEKDFHNNNVSHFMHRRRMSDEKKKIRRRHTVGGARDFEAIKDMMTEFNQMKLSEHDMNEANRLLNAKGTPLSAWEQLNLGESGDQVTIQKWLERQRYRSSATDIDMHNTPNIMHLERVGTRLAGPNVLQTNT